jgi:hypothetical protein
MGDFETRLFCTLLGGYLSILAPLYFGYRLRVGPQQRKIDLRRPAIRAKVIAYWAARHRDATQAFSLRAFLDEVLVEEIRVIGRRNDAEDRRFSAITWIFYSVTVPLAVALTCFVTASSTGHPLSTGLDYVAYAAFGALTVLQICTTAWLILANYYRHRYFEKLEDLETMVNDSAALRLDDTEKVRAK